MPWTAALNAIVVWSAVSQALAAQIVAFECVDTTTQLPAGGVQIHL